jgi:hypothetical protein
MTEHPNHSNVSTDGFILRPPDSEENRSILSRLLIQRGCVELEDLAGLRKSVQSLS